MYTQLLTIAAVMVALDAVWLTARGAATRTMFAAIQGSPIVLRWIPAAIVYVLMIAGLWWFAVRDVTSWITAAQKGAALGAVVYGVYDFTNYATITRWELPYAIADLAWGTFLFAATAAAAVAATA